MITIEDRRKVAQTIFMLKLMNGEICSDTVLEMNDIRTPAHQYRSTYFLKIHKEALMLTTFKDHNDEILSFANDLKLILIQVLILKRRNHMNL